MPVGNQAPEILQAPPTPEVQPPSTTEASNSFLSRLRNHLNEPSSHSARWPWPMGEVGNSLMSRKNIVSEAMIVLGGLTAAGTATNPEDAVLISAFGGLLAAEGAVITFLKRT